MEDKIKKRKEALRRYRSSEHGKKKRREYQQKLRMSVLDLLGLQCVRCGFNDLRALQIDHVNGGGAKEIREINSQIYKFMREKVLNGSKDYQILCANCNWIKRVENNEHRSKF